MDKQIIMREITECGFYCSKDDVERLYIYEVIKNTNEEWLKENPESTLLIDEWLYDCTDYNDRKVYYTSGNLISVCNASTCEVYKIEDAKYKIYGNCGQFLIEDKPTYKEQLDQLKEQLKAYKMEAEEGKEINAELKAENEHLSEKEEEARHYLEEAQKFKNCLTEIKEIAEDQKDVLESMRIDIAEQILNKTSEVLDENI